MFVNCVTICCFVIDVITTLNVPFAVFTTDKHQRDYKHITAAYISIHLYRVLSRITYFLSLWTIYRPPVNTSSTVYTGIM